MHADLALDWFRSNAGTESPFPPPLPNGDFLATKAKGIYKPANSDFALSIRTQVNSKYLDGVFVSIFDTGWAFAYHQETDKRLGINLFTNKAIDQNIIHHRPLGVLQEIPSDKKSNVKYFVHGLAIPIHKSGNYYIFCDEKSANNFSRTQILNAFFSANALVHSPPASQEDISSDLRISTYSSILARQGQGKFRRDLVKAYQGRCAISGESTLEVLDAAHIQPYRGQKSNTVNNGILIRTDLHNLFDFNLLAIDPDNFKVRIHSEIQSEFYRSIEGIKLSLPLESSQEPSKEFLSIRWQNFTNS
jgi:hypothetical protein